ncbi:MAG TPA: CpXC domain-containing protein [Spirochaetia bacterium]|nr:CpXC domain-containing protein [Spirochaetia bacterium]
MTTTSRRVACFCEATFEADVPSAADLAADPEVGELISSGNFGALTCPACGRRLTPEFPFRLGGVKRFGEIFMVPEADRVSWERGTLDYPLGTPARVTVGFPELAEKVLISGLDLDDRVIEIMKYYLLTGSRGPSGVEEEEDEGPDLDVTIRYRGREGERHLFHIMGMKDDEVGVARLADELYRKIAGSVESRVTEEPFSDFCVPPWVSLRRLTGAAG